METDILDLDLSELEDIVESTKKEETPVIQLSAREIKIDGASSPIHADDKTKTLNSDTSPFSLSLRIKNFASEKELDKFIKCVERLVRYSVEYKHWHDYITDNLGYDSCALTEESMGQTKVEIHHHPISLYTICKAAISKHLNNDEEVCSFDIATEVIELHFTNKVGYVALLSNLHEKYHNGFLEIPIELIHGDYKYIMDNYVIDDQELNRIYALCQIKLENAKKVGWSKNSYPGIK